MAKFKKSYDRSQKKKRGKRINNFLAGLPEANFQAVSKQVLNGNK